MCSRDTAYGKAIELSRRNDEVVVVYRKGLGDFGYAFDYEWFGDDSDIVAEFENGLMLYS